MRSGMLLAVGILVAVASTAPPRVDAAAADSGVTWLIFVDDLHLEFVNTGHVRMLLRSIASELIRDGDGFVLRSSGPSSLSIAFTTDRSLLDGAIRRVAGNELLPTDILRPSSGYDVQDEVRYRASVAASAALEMLNGGPSQAGPRKAMLYVTDGYPFDFGYGRDFATAARRSHVTVFAMNARGLPGGVSKPVQSDAALWASYRATMLDSLRALSEPTGGFAVLNEADFSDALQRIGRMVR